MILNNVANTLDAEVADTAFLTQVFLGLSQEKRERFLDHYRKRLDEATPTQVVPPAAWEEYGKRFVLLTHFQTLHDGIPVKEKKEAEKTCACAETKCLFHAGKCGCKETPDKEEE